VLRDPDLFRARAPHDLTKRAYAADFNEVKAVGSVGSAVRTPDQTAIANYWGRTNGTATISSILRSVANGQGGTACRPRPTARPRLHEWGECADRYVA
jgi:hypothetical protein